MEKDISVSFIIPVYNTDPALLEKCVGSTRDVCCKKEIILIDDGSTREDTVRVLKSYENINEVRVIHKTNGGPAAARNAGLDMARGKYIVFVDSDDMIAPEPFSELLSLMEEHNSDILCHTYDIIDDMGAITKKGNDSGEVFHFSAFNEIRELRDAEGRVPDFNGGLIWGKIYKRDVISHIRFDETLRYCEDNLFNMSPELRGRKITGIYKSAYIHLKNPESLCNKYNPMARKYFMTSALKMKEALALYKDKADWENFYETVIFHFYINNILTLDIFNSQNMKPLSVKKKLAKEVLTEEPFKTALKNIQTRTLSPKQKIVIMLLKMNMCRMVYKLFLLK